MTPVAPLQASTLICSYASYASHCSSYFPCTPLLHAFNPFHRVNKFQVFSNIVTFLCPCRVVLGSKPLALRSIATRSPKWQAYTPESMGGSFPSCSRGNARILFSIASAFLVKRQILCTQNDSGIEVFAAFCSRRRYLRPWASEQTAGDGQLKGRTVSASDHPHHNVTVIAVKARYQASGRFPSLNAVGSWAGG